MLTVTSVEMLTMHNKKKAKQESKSVRERASEKLLVKPALTYVKGRGKAGTACLPDVRAR